MSLAKERERAIDRIFEWLAPDNGRHILYTHFESRTTFVAKVYDWDYEEHFHTQQEKDDTPEITGVCEDAGQVTFNVPQDSSPDPYDI